MVKFTVSTGDRMALNPRYILGYEIKDGSITIHMASSNIKTIVIESVPEDLDKIAADIDKSILEPNG